MKKGINEKREREEVQESKHKSHFEVAGFPLPVYLTIIVLVVLCMYAGCLPGGFVGGFLVLIVFGEGLNAIGNFLPIVKTYLGGSVICILGAAAIQAAGLIPQETHQMIDNFVSRDGFLVFYISALITGSLLSIDRGLLLRATVKLLPTAVLSLSVGILLSGILGMCMGDKFLEGILYIGVPMTSGGMTAGAVPLSGIYSSVLNMDAGQILTRIAPATVLGNCVAIVFGGLAHNLGKKHPELTGNGRLVNDGQEAFLPLPVKPSFAGLCTGLVISLVFYELGALCNKLIPLVPTYAWMIVAVVAVKSTGIMSEALEDAARQWGHFSIHSFTSASLFGIGVTLIDLKTILATMTPFYVLSIVIIVASITLTASVVGKWMGFYPLESAITAGMCTTNMGGSGNVAVLSSAKRMELLPFSQIVTRSCGALMLTVGGILIQMLK